MADTQLDAPQMSDEDYTRVYGAAAFYSLEGTLTVLLNQHDRTLLIARSCVGLAVVFALIAQAFLYLRSGPVAAATSWMVLVIPLTVHWVIADPGWEIVPERSYLIRQWVDDFNSYGKSFGKRIIYRSTRATDLLELRWQARGATTPNLMSSTPPMFPTKFALLFGARVTPL